MKKMSISQLITGLLGSSCLLVPTLALAEEADAGGGSQVEEIVVTATKREAGIQKVSVPVTAISGERLQEKLIVDLQDLQYIAPTLTVNDGFGVALLSMRGLGLTSIFGNIEPSVGVYVDGAVVNTPAAQLASMFDLQRVEVLRGPQGTLFGRNTIAGAVNLITAKPTDEFTAYARVSAGNYAYVNTEGAISGPLTEKLLGRFAWKTTSQGGFGINEYTGNDVDDANRKAMRAQLQYNASDKVNFLVSGEYIRRNDHAFGLKFGGNLFPEDPTLRPPAGLGGLADNGSTTTRNIAGNIDPRNDRELWSTIGIFNWEINDHFRLKNTFDYRQSSIELQQDIDLSSIDNREDVTGRGTTINAANFYTHELSNELQLQYDGSLAGKPLQGIAGVIYFHEARTSSVIVSAFPNQGRVRIVNGMETTDPRLSFVGDSQTDSWGAFWNVHYEFVPRLSLKLGGRYSRDSKSADDENKIFVAEGLGPQISIPFSGSDVFENYSNEAGLEWQANDDLLLYYTFSQGYKSGASPSGTTDNGFVDPENISNHEFGLKSRFWSNKVALNVAGYFYTADGIQFQQTFLDPDGGFGSEFGNVTTQKAHGVEVEISTAPTNNFRLDGSVAYTDAHFAVFYAVDNYDPRTITDPGSVPEQNFGGNRPRYAPRWSSNVHAEYDIGQISNGLLTLSGDVSYKSMQYGEEVNSPKAVVDSYVIGDASLRYAPDNKRWTVSLWVKNISNELIASYRSPLFATNTSMIGQTFLPPRTWGATIGVNF